MARAGWSMSRAARIALPYRAARRSCSTCCRKARSNSRELRVLELSTSDHGHSPPRIDFPREYNAAHDLIERNLAAGRAERIAYIDDRGACSYGELAEGVNRFANALIGLGLRREERVLLCLHDTIDFPTAFLGAI